MKILLTGAAGFTGRFFSQAAQASGHDVWPLKANLLDASALRDEVRVCQPDAVVHLAAISFVAHADIEDIYRVNLLGTRHLLHALATSVPQVQHVLLASSATVYGNQAEGLIAETAIVQPANDYAVSKLAMESLAGLWRDSLPITVVRPFNYVGHGQSPRFVIPKIVAHVKARAAHIELGNLDVWREYNDVRWVVQAYLELLRLGPVVGPVNLASGQLHSLNEVLSLLRDLSGHSMDVVVNPAFVRPNEVIRLGGDPSRLSALGIAPPSLALADTLEWMLSCA